MGGCLPHGAQGRRPAAARGAALVIALLVMAALLLMGTSFLSLSSTEVEIARNAREAAQAFYVAEAGMARLKRDLLAQFTVPYRALCPTFDQVATFRRAALITEEPLGTPGQRMDADGAVTCRPPGVGVFHVPLDEQHQPVVPDTATWRPLTYAGTDLGGGTYRVEVRNATASTIEARVTVGLASATRAARQIEATFGVARFSPAEHALFVDGGVWRFGTAGAMTVAGPVFAKGWSRSFPALRLGVGGAADRILNYYGGMDPLLAAAVTPLTASPGQDVSLGAALRVYQGPVEIASPAASVGEPAVARNGVKETLDGVYTNHGFSGSPGAANVYADNGAGSRFDLPREPTNFPDLTGPYTGPPLATGSTPASHDAYLRTGTLVIDGGLTIDSTTLERTYGDCAAGNCLRYQPGQPASGGSPATPPTLQVEGIVWVKGNIVLGGHGGNRLQAIRYKGAGTLYARSGGTSVDPGSAEASSEAPPPDSSTLGWAGIEVTSDLLPSPTKPDGTPGARFPADHRLGLISSGWIIFGDSSAASGGSPLPALRIAANVFANYYTYNWFPYQLAGSLISRYYYVNGSVGVYYVPATAGPRPPGMPGVHSPKAASPYFLRTLSWRDIAP